MVGRYKSRYGKDQHNATLITKRQASGSAKIDFLIAVVNLITLMSTNPWSSRPRITLILSFRAA